MSFCPCGSQKNFEQCCDLYINKGYVPEMPEQLMRSRYTAYSLAKVDYIQKTMLGKPLIYFNAQEAQEWAQNVTWVGLKVIQAYNETSEKGFVEFAASFLEHNQLKAIHELSEFHKKDNSWFYIDGNPIKSLDKNNRQKIARNSPCPCGNGKKFKNCHGT